MEVNQLTDMKGVDMAAPDESGMSYGCQYGCGNAYQVILIQVTDSSVLMLCIPCFVTTAIDIVGAMTGEISPEVQQQADELKALNAEQAPGPRAKRGRHNAPAGNVDPDLFEAFDTVVTVDDLPDEFR